MVDLMESDVPHKDVWQRSQEACAMAEMALQRSIGLQRRSKALHQKIASRPPSVVIKVEDGRMVIKVFQRKDLTPLLRRRTTATV